MKSFVFERILPSLLCWFVAALVYLLIPLLAIGLGFIVIPPQIVTISKFFEPTLLLLFPLACGLVFFIVRFVELASAAIKKRWPHSKIIAGSSVIGNVKFKKKLRDECLIQMISLGSIALTVGLTSGISNLLWKFSTPIVNIGEDFAIAFILWSLAWLWETITG